MFILPIREKKVRNAIANELPTYASLMENPIYSLDYDTTEILREEQARLDVSISSSDIYGHVNRYPLRETGALSGVASDLRFRSQRLCESAVRKAVADDGAIKEMLRQKLESLTDAIEE